MTAQQATGVGVIVCGMPDSGNRLLQGLIEAHGAEAAVHHYGSFASKVQTWQQEGMTVAAIWPVRDEDVHRVSLPARSMLDIAAHGDYDGAQLAHFTRTVRLLAELRVPLLPVHLSQIVRNPAGLGRMMLGWLGISFQGWPNEVIDPDEKWRTGNESGRVAAIREATLAGDPSKEIIGSISASLHGRARTSFGRIARTNGAQQGNEELADLGRGKP